MAHNVPRHLVTRATERARASNAPYHVVEMDDGEEFRLYVVSDEYYGSDEYIAFDGRHVLTVFPDSSVE